METEAALSRRTISPLICGEWRELQTSIQWLDTGADIFPLICMFNRNLRLRAADAGHLFVFEKLIGVIPSIRLVTFDQEMKDAAVGLAMQVC